MYAQTVKPRFEAWWRDGSTRSSTGFGSSVAMSFWVGAAAGCTDCVACPNYYPPDFCADYVNAIIRPGELPRALFVELTADPCFAVHRVSFERKDSAGIGSTDMLDRI